MTYSCSNNCLITRSNQKHVTQHTVLGNPRQCLIESNLKLSRIQRLYWTISDASSELIQHLLYRIEIQAYLILASAHTWLPRQRGTYRFTVIGRSELIKTRSGVKTNYLKRVIFRNDPLSIHWRTAWTGLSKTNTLFNNLMHSWLLKNMV